MSEWTAEDVSDCAGRTVVVTGANSGIGLEATRVLAGAGAHVVMACRSVDDAVEEREGILEECPGASLTVRELDLADLGSVRAFADWTGEALGRIDVLYNNAGVMAIPRRETADGFETQFGVDHLGHFALTGLLFEELQTRRSPAPSPRAAAPTPAARWTSRTSTAPRRTASGAPTPRASWRTSSLRTNSTASTATR